MGKKQTVTYESYTARFDDGEHTVYLFYPDGVWDECKRLRSEALKAYPLDKYEWKALGDAT